MGNAENPALPFCLDDCGSVCDPLAHHTEQILALSGIDGLVLSLRQLAGGGIVLVLEKLRLDLAAARIHPSAQTGDLGLELVEPLDDIDLIGIGLLHHVTGLALNELGSLIVVIRAGECDLLELCLSGLVVDSAKHEVFGCNIRAGSATETAKAEAASGEDQKCENPEERRTAAEAVHATTNGHHGSNRRIHRYFPFKNVFVHRHLRAEQRINTV